MTSTQVPSNGDGGNTVSNGFGSTECESRNGEFLLEQLVQGTGDHNEISLCQRLIAALISEEDYSSGNEDLKVDAYLDGELGSNTLDHQSLLNFQFSGHSAYNGYRAIGKSEQNEPETEMTGIPHIAMNANFSCSSNGLLLDQTSIPNSTCTEFQYENMPINEKLLLEIQSIGIFPEPVVGQLFTRILTCLPLFSSVILLLSQLCGCWVVCFFSFY